MIVGFTASTFDLLHAGHIAMLREAKSVCDHLICGLQIDPSYDRMDKNKPVQTIVERHAQLYAVRYVDEIVPYYTENDLIDILKMYPINVRIIGEEYKLKDFTGKEECRQLGIDIYYNKRNHRFSSSGLRERISNEQSRRSYVSRGSEEVTAPSLLSGLQDSDGQLAGNFSAPSLFGDSPCGSCGTYVCRCGNSQ
jgi:glycerol-3-phosphate cytidylyltransferase